MTAQLPPVVQAAADLIEPVAQRGDDRLFLSVGALLDAQPLRESLAGESAVADPAAALEPGDRSLHDIGCPAAGRGVGQQRHPDPQLGQDVHLDRVQASRGRRGHVTVAAVLADQAAGPPQAVHGIARAAVGAPSAEQRAAHAVGGLRGVGEQARHLARVLAGQDLPQAGDRCLVAGLSQPVGRHGVPRGVPQGGHQAGLEPGEGGRDDSPGRVPEGGAPPADVAGEEVQAKLGQPLVRRPVPDRVHGHRLAGVTQPARGTALGDGHGQLGALLARHEEGSHRIGVVHDHAPRRPGRSVPRPRPGPVY